MAQVAPLPGDLHGMDDEHPVEVTIDRRTASGVVSSPPSARTASRFVATTSAVVVQAVAFGPVGYAFAWGGIYALHAVCAAYLIAAGRVYIVLPTTQVKNIMELYQLTVNSTYFPAIAYVHYALSSVHLYLVIKPVTHTVVTWCIPTKIRVRFTTSMESMAKKPSSLTMSRSFVSRPIIALSTVGLLLMQLVRRVYRVLLARDGLFGVHNDHFELFFLAREVVETVLQTYQGYMMSRLLPRTRLNGFYTLILVINCWTTPLLRRVCHGHKTLERLLVVLCDVVLDFVSSIAVPVVVAIGYIQQYDPASTDFTPWTLYYDDVWLLNFMNEAPIVIFGSWLDAASRLVFSLGLLSSMEDVKALITRRPRFGPLASTSATTAATKEACQKSSRRTTRSSSARVAVSNVAIALKTPEIQATISRWVHRVMVVWGIVVGGMYLEAYVRAPPTHCSLSLRPWLVGNAACAVVTIDCRKEQAHTGSTADLDAIFSTLDPASVEYVIFRHCPQVEIAAPFLSFRNLYGLKTYDSSIQRWGDDTAFTSTSHPRVRFLFLIATHFADATLPRGLHHKDYPQTLTDIEITGSNLQFIPSNLPWPRHMAISIESAQITEFPMALVRIKPFVLSLAFNKLTSMPAEAIMEPDIVVFCFRGNPITELPSTGVDIAQLHDMGSGFNLHEISIEYTNISSLPEWVTEQFVGQVRIRAAQTPLCNQILLNDSSPAREKLLEERPWLASVAKDCLKDPGPFGNYPVELETS